MTGLLHKGEIVVIRHFITIDPKPLKGDDTFGAFIEPAPARPLNKLSGRNEYHVFRNERFGGRWVGRLNGFDDLRELGVRGR